MNMKTLVASFILGAGLTSVSLLGCGWQQNPLDGKGNILKEARPNSGGGEKPKGDSSDLIYIDAPDAVTFIEGKKEALSVETHISQPGFTNVDLVIDNMSDFRGASYDGRSKKFEWAPPLGTVTNGLSINLELSLHVTAKNPKTSVVYTRDKKVLFVVQRSPQDPQVMAINFPSSAKLREGGIYPFSVTAKDMDTSSAGSNATGPELAILSPAADQISLASFVKFKDRTGDATTHVYTSNYELDLRGVEVTNSSHAAGFVVEAFSEFGRRSALVPLTKTIYTNLSSPLSTWADTKILKNNQVNVVPFIVYDSKGESMISLDRNDNVPVGGSIDCQKRFASGAIECTFTWTPSLDPAKLPGNGTIRMVVTSSNRDTSDTDTNQSTLQLSYQVISGSKP